MFYLRTSVTNIEYRGLKGCADDINIMARRKRAVSEVYEGLKEGAKELALNIIVEKTKAVVQNRRKRRISEILAIKDRDVEVVTSFKYLGAAITNTNGETEERKARILAAKEPAPLFKLYFYLNNSIDVIK